MLISLLLLLLVGIVSSVDPQCKPLNEYWDQVEPILQAMTLDQKVGQMTQASVGLISQDNVIDPHLVAKYNLGSLLVGGNFIPLGNGEFTLDTMDVSKMPDSTLENWLDIAREIFKPTTVADEYEVYPLLGTDSVHGDQHVLGTVLFPQNIGLAATHDPDCFKAAGYYMAKGVIESGFNYAFAPTVAVSHNPQWGRHYETMGSDPDMIYKYSAAFVEGAQLYNSETGKMDGVLTSAKHFMGDGATFWGVDQGNATVYNMKAFIQRNYEGYAGAISQCVGNVMCSYSGINLLPMASNSFLIQGILKQGLYNKKPFNGFVISDYDELGKIAHGKWPTTNLVMDQYDAVVLMINAGIDMAMLSPYNKDIPISYYQDAIKNAVQQKDISEDRINDAVRRILGVKMAMGLIKKKSENTPSGAGLLNDIIYEKLTSLDSHNPTPYKTAWEAALDAAKKSLVLLKNENEFLPLQKKDIKYVILVGDKTVDQYVEGQAERIPTVYQHFDDIGSQNGGWSLRHQGFKGNEFFSGKYEDGTRASSILDAIKARFESSEVEILHTTYKSATDMEGIKSTRATFLESLRSKAKGMNSQNTVIIEVLSEPPYAEGMGDINNPFCWSESKEGCLYAPQGNPYLPDENLRTLEIKSDDFSTSVINTVNKGKTQKVGVVSVLFSGRPMIVNDAIDESSAFIAAWLPGTQGGEAIVQSLFGEYLFRNGSESNPQNTLPLDWVSTMEDLKGYPVYKSNGDTPQIEHPLFKMGHGIATQKKE